MLLSASPLCHINCKAILQYLHPKIYRSNHKFPPFPFSKIWFFYYIIYCKYIFFKD